MDTINNTNVLLQIGLEAKRASGQEITGKESMSELYQLAFKQNPEACAKELEKLVTLSMNDGSEIALMVRGSNKSFNRLRSNFIQLRMEGEKYPEILSNLQQQTGEFLGIMDAYIQSLEKKDEKELDNKPTAEKLKPHRENLNTLLKLVTEANTEMAKDPYAEAEQELADTLGYTELFKLAPQEPNTLWNDMVNSMRDSLPYARRGMSGGLQKVMDKTGNYIQNVLKNGSLFGENEHLLDTVFNAYRQTVMEAQRMAPETFQPDEAANELLNKMSESPETKDFKLMYRKTFRLMNWAIENGPEHEAFEEKLEEAKQYSQQLNEIADSDLPLKQADRYLIQQGKKWVDEGVQRHFVTALENHKAQKQQAQEKEREEIKAGGWETVELSPKEKLTNLNEGMRANKRFGVSNSKEYEAVMKAQEKALKNFKENPTKAELFAMRRSYAKLKEVSENYLLSRKNPKTDKGKERYSMVKQNLDLIKEIEEKYPMTKEEAELDAKFLKDSAMDKKKFNEAKPGVAKEMLKLTHQAKKRMYENYLNGKNNYFEMDDDLKAMVLLEHFNNNAERKEQIGTKYQEYEYYTKKITLPDSLRTELYQKIDKNQGNMLMESLLFKGEAIRLQKAHEKEFEQQNEQFLGPKPKIKQENIPVAHNNNKVKGMN